jgi:hypothetical protein
MLDQASMLLRCLIASQLSAILDSLGLARCWCRHTVTAPIGQIVVANRHGLGKVFRHF